MKKIVFLMMCFCLVVLSSEPAMAETIRYWQVNVGVGQGSGSVYAEIYQFPFNVKTQTTTTTTGAVVSVQDEASAWLQTSIYKRYGKFHATPAAGYEFAGWYTDPQCTTGLQTDNPYQTESVIREDREVCTWTYYAKFTPIQTNYYSKARAYVPSEGAAGVYVTVNANTTYDSFTWVTSGYDQTTYSKEMATSGGHIYYFFAKPKVGYTLVGWSTTEGGSVSGDFTYESEKNRWVLNGTVTQSGTTSSNPQILAYYPVFQPLTSTLVVTVNEPTATIGGTATSKNFVMTYGSTVNNVISDIVCPKYSLVQIQDAAGNAVFDKDGNCIRGNAYFDADGCWISTSDVVYVVCTWAGRKTIVTLDAAPGGFPGGATSGQITLTQGSSDYFQTAVLNPVYPGYVFTGGYTEPNGQGYRVYRDHSRATTDGGYWHDSGTQTPEGIEVLTWNRGDLSALTLYAHWVEATFYFEVADGYWQMQECWKQFDSEGYLDSHQDADSTPQDFNPVVISRAVTINTEVSCYSLTIVEGGSVTIAPTGGLSVGEGGVTGATTDNFIIESTTEHQGYFRISPSATTPMPTATVLFATRSTLDTGGDKDATWQYFGVPCETTMTVDEGIFLHEWNTASGWVSKEGVNTLLPWQGYCITQYGQPTYTFTGQLLKGDQVISLNGETATQGMNLIANSYSAPIDVTKFTAEDFSGDLIQTFYIYNAGSWNQWNNNKSTTPSAAGHTPGTYTAIPALAAAYLTDEQTLIAPMQAIMIQLTDASATVSFNYAKHVWAAAASGGSTMTDPVLSPTRANHQSSITNHQSEEGPLSSRIRLSVGSANSGVDHFYLLGGEDWTAGYDNGYDAPKMATRGLVNIYTTISEGMLAVDARAHLDSTYVGFAAGSDTDYTLCFSALLGEQYDLIDLYNYTRVTMTEGVEYCFEAEPNTVDNQRFLVVRTAEQPGVATNLPEVQSTAEGPAMVYTLTGQYVGTRVPSAKGVYIVRQGQTITKIAQQ